MQELKIGSIIASIVVAWGIFKKAGKVINNIIGFIIKLSQDPEIKELIQRAEDRARDGKIDRADRKDTAMEWINFALKVKGVKLNPLQRFILNKVVDKIAEELPDFILNNGIR